MTRTRSALLLICLATLSTIPAYANVVVYDDALASDWQDWSWGGVTNDFNRTSPVHTGSASIAVTYTAGWSGLQLGDWQRLDVSAYDALRFYVHGGSGGGQTVQVQVGDSNTGTFVTRSITPAAGTWTQVDVGLADLGSARSVSYVYWFNATAGSQPTFYLDDIAFVASGAPTPTPLPPAAGPLLSVDATANRHSISPYIYGMNFADEGLASELQLPVRRWGGNATTRYNWQTDTNNHASDWFFENIPNDNANPAALPDGSSSDQFIEQDRRTGTATLLTVPLIGWTPKDRTRACGFSVSKYGAQQSTDPWMPDCGNGLRPDGTDITGNNALDTSTRHHPGVRAGVDGASDRASTARPAVAACASTISITSPSCGTTRTATCIRRRRATTRCATAPPHMPQPSRRPTRPRKHSGQHRGDGRPTSGRRSTGHRAGRGGTTRRTAWRMATCPSSNGTCSRCAPTSNSRGRASSTTSTSTTIRKRRAYRCHQPAGHRPKRLRLRSTRSLWDPSYTDESWIGEPVRLVPRMHDWVSANYAGTKLAVSEYNWGALDHINGALAQADVLGIFGREGLDLATLWDPPTASQPGAYAFRMYLNYDGARGRFGDVSVSAVSTDQAQLAIYAAQETATSTVSAIIINKTAQALTSTIALSHFTAATTARVYRYSDANLGAIVRDADQPVAPNGFTASFPAVVDHARCPAAVRGTARCDKHGGSDSNPNAYGLRDVHTNIDVDAAPDTDDNAHCLAYLHPDAVKDIDGIADTYSDMDTVLNADADAHTHVNRNSGGDRDSDSDSDSDASPNADTHQTPSSGASDRSRSPGTSTRGDPSSQREAAARAHFASSLTYCTSAVICSSLSFVPNAGWFFPTGFPPSLISFAMSASPTDFSEVAKSPGGGFSALAAGPSPLPAGP